MIKYLLGVLEMENRGGVEGGSGLGAASNDFDEKMEKVGLTGRSKASDRYVSHPGGMGERRRRPKDVR